MTPEKIIEQIDYLHPNNYRSEDKMVWISEVEGMVQRLVMQQDDDEVINLSYPEDLTTELLVGPPFDGLYGDYVQAMMDYHSKDINNYNNSARVFYSRFDDYRKLYIREHMPKQHGVLKL